MASTPSPQEFQGAPPRVSEPSRELQKAQAEREAYVREREGLEQRSMLRGLIVLAVLVLCFSIWRAGLGRVFVGRWWWP